MHHFIEQVKQDCRVFWERIGGFNGLLLAAALALLITVLSQFR